ncbi:tRNA threonylcarbamoyladenosine dehydratase [Akkermansiaceae bacterium]|nr:tRNA threonylcarbamoyladenosine dehydratase [Akkermansiaceae bacterium]
MNTLDYERFGGIARLYGIEAFEKISSSHVCIVGIGGVGAWAAESLARSGVNKITLVDLDDICITNMNRQPHATTSTIGKQKVEVMQQRILDIHPTCVVNIIQKFYTPNNSEIILEGNYDYLIDSIDEITPKAHLISSCKNLNIPVISCGGAGGLHDATFIKVADMAKVENDNLLKRTRTTLRNEYRFPKATTKKAKNFGVKCVFSTESPSYPTADGCISERKSDRQKTKLNCNTGFGSATHVTASFGLIAAQMCLEHLSSSE